MHVLTDLSFDVAQIPRAAKSGAPSIRWADAGNCRSRKVLGPFIRVRVGDTVDVTLINVPDSNERHSVDLHAVTGTGVEPLRPTWHPARASSLVVEDTRTGGRLEAWSSFDSFEIFWGRLQKPSF